jgi:hypothetical protein
MGSVFPSKASTRCATTGEQILKLLNIFYWIFFFTKKKQRTEYIRETPKKRWNEEKILKKTKKGDKTDSILDIHAYT